MADTATAPLLTSHKAKPAKTPSIDDTIETYIGATGATQLLKAVLLAFAWAFDAQQVFISVFTDAEPQWHCTGAAAGGNSSCSPAVASPCALPPGTWAWDRPAEKSVVSEWSLKCAGPALVSLPASSFFAGCLAGGFLLTTLADSLLGRKKMLLVSLVAMSISGVLTAFSPNVWVYAALRFVSGFGRSMVGTCTLVLSTELVGKRWRDTVSVAGFFCFTVGFLSLPALAYTFREASWRNIYLWTSVPSLCYSILLYFLVQESPRWLLVRGRIDADHYSGWKDMIRDLRRGGVRTMTYCNPCLVPMDQKPNTRRHMYEEAKKLGILVRDQTGEPYMLPNTAFDVAMLDFTNPEARVWFKKILQGMADDGVSGWMADFGEGLPLDAQLHSGEDPVAAHNRYPELWARVNREFADEWKYGARVRHAAAVETKDDGDYDEEGLVFFVRSGFRESSRWAMLFWEGDQMVSWQANDGIKSSVVGLLSGGLSGFPLNHSDAGGYCTVDLPLLRYRRSEELLMRWMEVNAFTVVFRTHEGNKPGSNCQFYSNSRTLAHFARCAKIYKAWEFYRTQLVKEAAEKGLPVARHLFLHYPEDQRVQRMTYQQFLVGTEMLVVPVLDKGRSAVTTYFPVPDGGSWRHVWTGDEFGGHRSERGAGEGTVHGFEAEVEAPVGYPAVFVRVGSAVGERFVSNLRDLKLL